MRKFIFFLLSLALFTVTAQAKVVGEVVNYRDHGVVMKGYLAYDTGIKAKRPGVLVVHEWWGLNDYARKRATMLAEMGYIALALDMYGDGKTAEHPNEAGKFATEVNKNMPLAQSRFEAGRKFLVAHKTVAQGQIAAIGYCFGGGVVLNMARLGAPLKAVASFHGALATATPAAPGKVKARIAIYTGADDAMVPKAQVDAFVKEMESAGVDYRLVSYPGAKHSFTNPDADRLGKQFNLPIAYNAAADQDSWTQLGTFLAAVFGPR